MRTTWQSIQETDVVFHEQRMGRVTRKGSDSVTINWWDTRKEATYTKAQAEEKDFVFA